jgi:protein-S-isoprenylcysteine O-methyltransferase Ste14
MHGADAALPVDPNTEMSRGAPRALSLPPTAIPWPVGLAGLAVALGGLYLAAGSMLDPAAAALLLMIACLAPALVFDGVPRAVRAWRDSPPRASPGRVAVKLVGLATALGAAAAIIAVFPFFHRAEFAALSAAAPWAIAILAPIAALYVALVDCVATEKEDGLHALGALVLGRAYDLGALNNFLRAQAVKLFFFTLMLYFAALDIAFFRETPIPASPFGSVADFWWFNRLIFACDVMLAGLGYIATFRLFGWEVREADPTLGGWLACLICYEPFFSTVERAFLNYHSARPDALPGGPIVSALWIVAILGCNVVYLLATVAFGPLFSNLTRRAIVTVGPYAYTKHPAYLAKNLSWWILQLPSLLGDSLVGATRRAIMLAAVNAIYFARARCEERLLAHDPIYRAYADYIASHGLLAVLRRAAMAVVSRGRAAPASENS